MNEQGTDAARALWESDRTFVRGLAGRYGEVYRSLLEQPRVFKTSQVPLKGGPVMYHKDGVRPYAGVTQALEIHMEVFPPGSRSQKHAHMNSAIMYVLEGRGYDVHDGERIDWRAGDCFIVENGCVHQHFCLAESERPARLVIFKGKPLFLFFHMLFQKMVERPPQELPPGWEGWQPGV